MIWRILQLGSWLVRDGDFHFLLRAVIFGVRERVPCADTHKTSCSLARQVSGECGGRLFPERGWRCARAREMRAPRALSTLWIDAKCTSARARVGGWGKEMSTIIYSFAKVARPTTLDANCKLECSARKCEQRKVFFALLCIKPRLNLRRWAYAHVNGIFNLSEIVR